MFNLCYHRPAIEGLWVAHAHALDASCPKLRRTASAQFPLYEAGLNALADKQPDTGSRAFVVATMNEFATRMVRSAVDVIVGTTTGAGTAGTYTVRSGDTLGRIAAHHQVTVAQLVHWNRIKNANVISVGQVLKVEAPATQQTTFPTLKPGSRGPAVLPLQGGLLHTFPAYAGRIKHPGGGPNDIYGPNTEAVVKEFQRRSKLPAHGVVDPITWKELANYGLNP